MAIEVDYYRRRRHLCRDWVKIGSETIGPDDTGEISYLYPLKVSASSSEMDDDRYANIFASDGKYEDAVAAIVSENGEWNYIRLSNPILLEDGQTLQISYLNKSIDLKLKTEVVGNQVNPATESFS